MGVQEDYLSQLLHRGEIGWSVMLLGMLAAFAFGAVHALSPGHGKTLVAAYLVGARGTPRHAVFLGLMVTFTHTISVFALGLVTLYLSRFVLPETLTPLLGAIIGLTVLFAKKWLPESGAIGRAPLLRNALIYLPIASAAFIVCIGLGMTWLALRPAP